MLLLNIFSWELKHAAPVKTERNAIGARLSLKKRQYHELGVSAKEEKQIKQELISEVSFILISTNVIYQANIILCLFSK